jgi:Dolichyl-phosphate-mannose-protein mannosyltransferase
LLAAVGVSRLCERALSTAITPDIWSYWATLPDLARPEPGEMPFRTPLYSLMFARVHAAGGSGRDLLWVQYAARGLACGAIAWFLARSRPRAALAMGVLLAVDPVGAAMSTSYLSESLYSTGLLLGLATLVPQLQSAAARTPARLVGAGLLYGWACLFRPTGFLLVVPILLAY